MQKNQKRLFDVELVEGLVSENERLFEAVRCAVVTLDEVMVGGTVDLAPLMRILRGALKQSDRIETPSAPLADRAVEKEALSLRASELATLKLNGMG